MAVEVRVGVAVVVEVWVDMMVVVVIFANAARAEPELERGEACEEMLGPGRGGAGAPTIADRKVCKGSPGSVLAKVAAADSWDPSNVDNIEGCVRGVVTKAGGATDNGRSTAVFGEPS